MSISAAFLALVLATAASGRAEPDAILEGGSAPGQAVVPSQWIVKQYTEALGRVPDAAEYREASRWFAAPDACNAQTIRAHGRSFFEAEQFLDLPYGHAARLLTAYRAILNREPDQQGFDNRLAALESGTVSWSETVAALYADPEVDALVPAICGTQGFDPAAYYFGDTPAPTLPVGGEGFPGGTGQDLQARLLTTPPGGTVVLAQRSVTRLDQPLVIPPGVTLTTAGSPSPEEYANMGRLARNTPYTGDAIYVGRGAKLHNVWFDGQLGHHRSARWSANAPGLVLMGGAGTELRDSRVSNTNGHRAVYVAGVGMGGPGCLPGDGNETWVTGNLVTAYAGSHYDYSDGGHYVQDGISVACGNTKVVGNTVVDATDVAIIVFFELPAQASDAIDNTVVQSGLSSWAAYSASPEGIGANEQRDAPLDFTGVQIQGNRYWTGERAHLDIALSVGSRSWFGDSSAFGRGARFVDNHGGLAPDLPAHVVEMIGHSGMLDATVIGNTGWVNVDGAIGWCPAHEVVASVSSGWASGAIQDFTDVDLTACIGHPTHPASPPEL